MKEFLRYHPFRFAYHATPVLDQAFSMYAKNPKHEEMSETSVVDQHFRSVLRDHLHFTPQPPFIKGSDVTRWFFFECGGILYHYLDLLSMCKAPLYLQSRYALKSLSEISVSEILRVPSPNYLHLGAQRDLPVGSSGAVVDGAYFRYVNLGDPQKVGIDLCFTTLNPNADYAGR